MAQQQAGNLSCNWFLHKFIYILTQLLSTSSVYLLHTSRDLLIQVVVFFPPRTYTTKQHDLNRIPTPILAKIHLLLTKLRTILSCFLSHHILIYNLSRLWCKKAAMLLKWHMQASVNQHLLNASYRRALRYFVFYFNAFYSYMDILAFQAMNSYKNHDKLFTARRLILSLSHYGTGLVGWFVLFVVFCLFLTWPRLFSVHHLPYL